MAICMLPNVVAIFCPFLIELFSSNNTIHHHTAFLKQSLHLLPITLDCLSSSSWSPFLFLFLYKISKCWSPSRSVQDLFSSASACSPYTFLTTTLPLYTINMLTSHKRLLSRSPDPHTRMLTNPLGYPTNISNSQSNQKFF